MNRQKAMVGAAAAAVSSLWHHLPGAHSPARAIALEEHFVTPATMDIAKGNVTVELLHRHHFRCGDREHRHRHGGGDRPQPRRVVWAVGAVAKATAGVTALRT